VSDLVWSRSVRTGNVRTAAKHANAKHRGEVYGQQYGDLSEDWWRECHDCGEIVSYITWDEAMYDAIVHYVLRNALIEPLNRRTT
jgi:hypothetical protein